MARQGFSGAPLALRTLTRPRAAGARWRAGTARNALGRRTGAIRCPAWPTRHATRTRGDIAHCAQLLCLSQVQHIMPNITKSAGAGHRLTSTPLCTKWDALPRRPPRDGCFRALPARALLSILNQHSLGNQNGFSSLLAASPTGSNSIPECTSKNLAFPSTPVATCLLYTSPSPRDRTRPRMPSSA